MANIKSAIKRIKITLRNTMRNKKYLSAIKISIKKYLLFLDTCKNNNLNLTLGSKILSLLYSQIDKAKKINALHKNTASRKKSYLYQLKLY